MPAEEFLNQSIARLSALPPRKRLEAFRAIQDPGERSRVAKALPLRVYSEMMAESMAENLNRNVQARQSQQNPHNKAA